MAEILVSPNLEDLPPKERGQWVLSQAQSRLITKLEEKLAYRTENPDGWVRQQDIDKSSILLDSARKSPNLVYKRKGIGEYLEGQLDEYGEVSVRGDNDGWHLTGSLWGIDSWRAKEIWETFGDAARMRGEMAREVVKEIGFDVIGKDIPTRPPYVTRNSYDDIPQLPRAGKEYQERAAAIMRERLIKSLSTLEKESPDNPDYERHRKYYSDRLSALDMSMGLEYSWGYNRYSMTGTVDGKGFEGLADGVHSGTAIYLVRWGSDESMPNDEAEELFKKLHEVVSERDVGARGLQDHEEYILEQLGVV